jgi:PAS domain S-box-containing protein
MTENEPPGASLFRQLFELSPDANFFFASGIVVVANDAAARLFRAPSVASLIGRRSADLLHPDCWPAVERRTAHFMAGRIVSARARDRFIRFDGSTVDVETAVARATFSKGKAFIVSLRDAAKFGTSLDTQGADEPARPLDTLVEAFAARYNLPPAQCRIVHAAAESSVHEVICDRLDISKNTLKTQIRRILDRTGADSLEALVAPLRTAALRR